ncbi:MAG: DHH family phosphoesterase [Odoribacteraceae bacterium]|jgi:phosphoesterase RecJ-like protein|nr:DHH family phosphoesterase [Odoribacteraceae bacterium]
MKGSIAGKFKKRLENPSLKVAIIPHISADGDAAGACSALWQVLDRLGIEARVITCDYFPDYLRWLKRLPDAISFQNRPAECKQWLQEAGLLCMIDHNTFEREGDLEPFTRQFQGEIMMIDHHPDPIEVTYRFSDTRVSSTCELLYILVTRLWGRKIVDARIADAIYTGITTDTGGFSHNSSRPNTYRVVAELLSRGLDKEGVFDRIYQRNTLSRLRLEGHCLLNKMTIEERYPLAIIPVTLHELETFHFKEGDLEGIVNMPLTIAGVFVSVQVTEREKRVKLSFRSKGEIPVNEWARRFFNGGGHKNAAGGQLDLPIDACLQRLRESAAWFFDEYLDASLLYP